MSAKHSEQTVSDGIHIPTRWEYVDTTARDAASYTAADIGGIARVGAAAPYDFYLLTDDTGPTWIQIGAGGGSSPPFVDTTALVQGSADATKQMRIEVDGLTTGTTRVLTMPDADITPDDQSASRPPTGSAGGDLSGSYPNPTVNDGADGTAIHDNIAGEIAAVTLKASPVSADLVLIEDSADSNNKKRATVGSLAGGGDVTGPASSTDNGVARFDGTTGKLIQDGSGAVLNDTGALSGIERLALKLTTGDVGSPQNGEIWYSDSTGRMRMRAGTSQSVVGSSSPQGAVTANTIPFAQSTNGNLVGFSSVQVGGANNRQLSGLQTATFQTEFDNGTQGASWTLDWNNGQKQRVTLNASTTSLSITNAGVGNFILRVIQDGTGGWNITWPGSVQWPGGTAPALGTGPNTVHVISFYRAGVTYYAQAALSFS